jgi:hypothetical protein
VFAVTHHCGKLTMPPYVCNGDRGRSGTVTAATPLCVFCLSRQFPFPTVLRAHPLVASDHCSSRMRDDICSKPRDAPYFQGEQ